MAVFEQLWPDGPLFAQAEHFRLSTDCVLLADFANIGGAKRGIDLGCASGAAVLLLLSRSDTLHMTGLEIVEEAAELARMNMEANSLAERSSIVTGDIRRHRELFRTGSFDLVVANPPYFPVGSGPQAQNRDRAGARAESQCSLEDICTAAAFLCRTGGCVCFVHKPERLSELFCCMTAHGIEPKRLRPVCHTAGSAPNLVLVEGRRGGRPGLNFETPLILRGPDSSETDEVKRIYHRI